MGLQAYSLLFREFNTIGLQFFTVYGSWGRPDMPNYLCANAIVDDSLQAEEPEDWVIAI